MKRLPVIVALLLGVTAAGCSGFRSGTDAIEFPSPEERQRPPYDEGIQVGESYNDYVLHTHCGITHAEIDGTFWEADPPLVENGSPPEGWSNPLAEGTLTIESESRAEFESDGQIAHFERADVQPPPCD